MRKRNAPKGEKAHNQENSWKNVFKNIIENKPLFSNINLHFNNDTKGLCTGLTEYQFFCSTILSIKERSPM